MSDEEEELSKQLAEHRIQLALIQKQSALGDGSNQELQELKHSLEELCQLLESELVKIQKTKLLKELALNSPIEKNDAETVENNESSSIENNEDEISGLIQQFNSLECSVPFKFQNGQIEYHDAVIRIDEDQQFKDLKDIKAKAFFLYPITDAMFTCPFFLCDSCKYETTCKYSHGYGVSLNLIQAKTALHFDEDLGLAEKVSEKNLSCLVMKNSIAEQKVSLWLKAKLLNSNAREEKVLVRLEENNQDFWVNLDRVVFLNHDDDQTVNEEDYKDVSFNFNDENSPVIDQKSISVSNFGEWERYTSGIGSKLLFKMGYIAGQGLGVRQQGRVEPVEQIIYPVGKSLDHCMNFKQKLDEKKTDLKEILKQKVKKLKFDKKLAKDYDQPTTTSQSKRSLFDFLNNRILDPGKCSNRSNPSKLGDEFKNEISSLGKDQRNLNRAMFKVAEDLRRAETELSKLQKSHRKNCSIISDRSMLQALESKLQQQTEQVNFLRRKQQALNRENKTRRDRTSFVSF